MTAHVMQPELPWRGFGTVADLGIDFAGPQLEVVTSVLAACSNDSAEAAALRLTLAGRIGGLAPIIRNTDGDWPLPLVLRCAACAEAMQVELPLAAVTGMAAEAEAQPMLSLPRPGGGTVRLRRPTGDDQRRWRTRDYATESDAAWSVFASLLDGPADVDNAELTALGEVMADADPLPCFHISTACPACSAAADAPVDLEAALLARLAQRQRSMLDEVHMLASRYGWTETEVLALPAFRRRAYLARLQDGVA